MTPEMRGLMARVEERWRALPPERRIVAEIDGHAVRAAVEGRATPEDLEHVSELGMRLFAPDELPERPACAAPECELALVLRLDGGVVECYRCGSATTLTRLFVPRPRKRKARAT